jgi:PAS domain S-box-containing protein
MLLDPQLLIWLLALAGVCLLFNHLRKRLRVRPNHPSLGPAGQLARDDLFENPLVGYLELDRQGIVRRVNRRQCDFLGRPAQEILGRPYADLNPGGDRLELAQKLAGGISPNPCQRKVQRPDGTVVTLEVCETLLCGRTGNALGLRLAALDVTERMRSAEDAL